MTKRAAIYARISKSDRRVAKVENQIELCRTRLAAEHGYEVVAVFADDGIAASGKGIDDTTLENRPGARALLEAMRAGEFDVLLAVEGERLARTYGDGLEFIRASVEGGIIWHLDTDGVIDPSTPAGEELAVSIFASGRREGRVRSFRQGRRYDAERAAGMPLWGARPFGYQEDRITLRTSESDLIAAAVVDYLGGKRSLLRIARDWTDAGVLTDSMQRIRVGRDGVERMPSQVWTATAVRQLLLRDRNAGLLVHDGAELPVSQIEPIITVAQLKSLRENVKSGTPVGERARSLLGGLLRCQCGAVMHGTMSYSQRKGGPRHVYQNYKCSKTLYDKSQRHASIQQSMVDDLFIAFVSADLFHGRLESPETSGVQDALQDVAARLSANAEDSAHVGSILMDRELKTLHAKARGELAVLDVQREELEAERGVLLARARDDGGLSAFMELFKDEDIDAHKTPEDFADWEARFREAWEGIDIDKRQALIRSRYRPSVQVGGRGVGRVLPNPIDPSTFGQPVEVSDAA